MPEILRRDGWRIFFYSKENDEPIHVHCVKAEKSAKFFLDETNNELIMSYAHKMNNKDIRQVEEILYDNFNYVVKKWKEYFK